MPRAKPLWLFVAAQRPPALVSRCQQPILGGGSHGHHRRTPVERQSASANSIRDWHCSWWRWCSADSRRASTCGHRPRLPTAQPDLPLSVLLHARSSPCGCSPSSPRPSHRRRPARPAHKLGAATLVLAATLIPLMYLTSMWQVQRANQPTFTDPLTCDHRAAGGDRPLCGHDLAGLAHRRTRSGTSARC